MEYAVLWSCTVMSITITTTTTRKQILSTIAILGRLCAQESPNLRDSQRFPGVMSETSYILKTLVGAIYRTAVLI